MTVYVHIPQGTGTQTRGGATVALWERHPDHPGGEVFLYGDAVFEVALTPAVEARLRSGVLELVEEAAAAPAGDRALVKPVAAKDGPAVGAPDQEPAPASNAGPVPVVDAPPAGQVLPAEEPLEEVSVVERVTGPGAPSSRTNRRPAKGSL
jgi:hypothetical protein